MKSLLYISLIGLLSLSCKKDSGDVYPQASFSTISGKWHSIEMERSSLDNKSVWEPIAAAQSDTIVFRGDGVILNADGSPACCAPTSLIINGQLIDIRPQSGLPVNPLCATVNCVNCPTWEVSWNDDQLIITTCNAPRVKYVR
ncbi:hypothetical protein [Dyadobacter sp. MSC1_007]|jgi:hypothetical protein|uniref:hypothetical protein n=1 Tax=Dyadobacter sp. MSC1_007 TaxID=2909264 RepID=UPI00203040E7|nr:hypothetical protein [Dyadobacter sp. MSC1_007]